MPRTRLIVLLALAVMALVAAPAFAHVPAPAPIVVPAPVLIETITAAAPEPSLPWTVVAALLAAASVAVWQPRRAVALALVLVAGVLAFETGVHSTHHLGQAGELEQCFVAGMTTQLSADLVDAPLGGAPVAVADIAVATPAAPMLAARNVAPDAGRAPPAPSA